MYLEDRRASNLYENKLQNLGGFVMKVLFVMVRMFSDRKHQRTQPGAVSMTPIIFS